MTTIEDADRAVWHATRYLDEADVRAFLEGTTPADPEVLKGLKGEPCRPVTFEQILACCVRRSVENYVSEHPRRVVQETINRIQEGIES